MASCGALELIGFRDRVVVLLNNLEVYQRVKNLQRDLNAVNDFKRHAPELQPLLEHLRADILEMAKSMDNSEIQHAIYAATHQFVKKNIRRKLKTLMR